MPLKELINKFQWNGYVPFVWFLALYGDDRCSLSDTERGLSEKHIERDSSSASSVFPIRPTPSVDSSDDSAFCLKMGVKFGTGVIGL